jgi:hypothetical protein
MSEKSIMFDQIWDENTLDYLDSGRFQHPLYDLDEEHGYNSAVSSVDKSCASSSNSRQISGLLNDIDDMTIRTFRTRGSKEPPDRHSSWRSSSGDNLSGLLEAVDDMTLSTRTTTTKTAIHNFPQDQARSRRSLSVPARKVPLSSEISILLREADEMTFKPIDDNLSVTNTRAPMVIDPTQRGRGKRSSSVPVKKVVSSDVSIMLKEADEMTFQPLRNVPVRPTHENFLPLPVGGRNRPPQAPHRSNMPTQQKRQNELKEFHKRPEVTNILNNEKRLINNNDRHQLTVNDRQRKQCIGCLASAKMRYALTAVCVSLIAGCVAFLAAMTLYPTFFSPVA